MTSYRRNKERPPSLFERILRFLIKPVAAVAIEVVTTLLCFAMAVSLALSEVFNRLAVSLVIDLLATAFWASRVFLHYSSGHSWATAFWLVTGLLYSFGMYQNYSEHLFSTSDSPDE